MDDYIAWQAKPESSRDLFGAELIRREVLAKNRRALALYGAGHFFRKVVDCSIVTLLEGTQTRVFTIWTNAAFELSSAQADVQQWPEPSLASLRGTTLGRVGIASYLGPNAGQVPREWLAPMEEQFNAVLHHGPLSSTITLDRPTPWRCDEPAWAERVRRANVQRPEMGDRPRTQCGAGDRERLPWRRPHRVQAIGSGHDVALQAPHHIGHQVLSAAGCLVHHRLQLVQGRGL